MDFLQGSCFSFIFDAKSGIPCTGQICGITFTCKLCPWLSSLNLGRSIFSDPRVNEDNFSSWFGQGLAGSVPERHTEEFLQQKAFWLLVRVCEVPGTACGRDWGRQLCLHHRVSNAHLSLENAAHHLHKPCKGCLLSCWKSEMNFLNNTMSKAS